ncbi:MAG: DUF4190 domain-containing protein [archaeon]
MVEGDVAQLVGRKTNTFSILSLIFAFIFPLLGLIFGVIALVQIKKNPSLKGKGLAIAGIIISIVIPLLLVGSLVMLLFFTSDGQHFLERELGMNFGTTTKSSVGTKTTTEETIGEEIVEKDEEGFYLEGYYITESNIGDYIPLLTDSLDETSRQIYITYNNEGMHLLKIYYDEMSYNFDDIYEYAKYILEDDGWTFLQLSPGGETNSKGSFGFGKYFDEYFVIYDYYYNYTGRGGFSRIIFWPEGTSLYDDNTHNVCTNNNVEWCASDEYCIDSNCETLTCVEGEVAENHECVSEETSGFDLDNEEEETEEETEEDEGSEPWYPPTPSMSDCGEDYDCFMDYANTCTPSNVIRNVTMDVFGIGVVTTTTYSDEIRGEVDGKCIFYIDITYAGLEYSNTLVQAYLDSGMTQEEIDQQEADAQATQALFVGRDGWCKFDTTDLYNMLNNWNQGNYSSGGHCDLNDEGNWVCDLGGDFAVAEDCQGSYFTSSF